MKHAQLIARLEHRIEKLKDMERDEREMARTLDRAEMRDWAKALAGVAAVLIVDLSDALATVRLEADNHHNPLLCAFCNPEKLALAPPRWRSVVARLFASWLASLSRVGVYQINHGFTSESARQIDADVRTLLADSGLRQRSTTAKGQL